MHSLKGSSKIQISSPRNSSKPPTNHDIGRMNHLPLQIEYVDPVNLPKFVQEKGNYLAGIVNFGIPNEMIRLPSPSNQMISIGMTQLNSPQLVEVWTGDSPFTYHHDHGFQLAFNEQFLWGTFLVNEQDSTCLQSLTHQAYQSLLSKISTLHFPYLWRAWNYFPAINHAEAGLERYKEFCMGRHLAFTDVNEDFATLLPAASAIGTQSGPFCILFLAGKNPGIHIENPRQVSAYNYPPIYGPKSPSFSRGTFGKIRNQNTLLVAGTSSIVGHATQHVGNPIEQTKETLENIEALIHHTRKILFPSRQTIEYIKIIKVYLRHPEHYSVIKPLIHEHFGDEPPTLFLHGDICRKELLVEIEAVLFIQ